MVMLLGWLGRGFSRLGAARAKAAAGGGGEPGPGGAGSPMGLLLALTQAA
jgi:hypothetical protein